MWIVIVSLALGMFLGQRFLCLECPSVSPAEEKDTVVTVVRFDTISRSGDWNGSELIERDQSFAAIPGIDTQSVVSAYLEKRSYRSEFQDSSLHIEVKPVIFQNTLDSISLNYRFIRPRVERVVERRIVPPVPTWSIYGGVATYIHPEHSSFLPTIQGRYRENLLFGVGISPWSESLSFHLSVTFKLFDIP